MKKPVKPVKKVPKGLMNPKAAKGAAASSKKGANRNSKANRPVPMKKSGRRR
jgi:hypothetical protein